MREISVYYTGRNLELVRSIIDTEDLTLDIRIAGNALGDTMIEIFGNKEDVSIFVQIAKMIGLY